MIPAESLAVSGRPGGYIGYWRHLEFELRRGLVPIDAVDASALRPGTHEVEIRNVQHTRTGSRVTFVGKAGRRHTHVFDRHAWDSFGAALGSTCRIRLVRSDGAYLARAPSGLVVALEPGGGILGAYPSVDAARRETQVAELVLEYAEVVK